MPHSEGTDCVQFPEEAIWVLDDMGQLTGVNAKCSRPPFAMSGTTPRHPKAFRMQSAYRYSTGSGGRGLAERPIVKTGRRALYIDRGNSRIYLFKNGGVMIRRKPVK
jgi:hypothetical protein